MTTYCVKWGGEEATVVAENETDVWAQFCDGHIAAQRTPNAFEREITVVDGDESESEDSPAGSSPVANLSADEAKDSIGRMKSRDKLQAIITNDTRTTVVEAATGRLAELGE